MEALTERLALVLSDLVGTTQGWVVTEAAADELLGQLRAEFVPRMLADLEPWGGDEDLRAPVTDLVTRHFLPAARACFVQRVVAPIRN